MRDLEIRLLERERELAALAGLAARASAGEGALVLVEGPPGIGKTRLLAAARAGAEAAGLVALGARGGPLERPHPFGVSRQLLAPLAGATGAGSGTLTLADSAAALLDARGMPGVGERGGDPAFALFEGLYRAVAARARVEPLLLVVDDAHWADRESLRFLAYLATRLERLAVLLVLGFRPHQPGAARDLLGVLAADPQATVLALAPLSHAAVCALVEDHLGAAAAPEFVAACRHATGGNPFLIVELLGALARERVQPTAAGAGRVLGCRPSGITRAVLPRVAALPRSAHQVAAALAVLGGRAPLPIVAALSDLDAATVAAAADLLVEADVLAAARPLEFLHPLVCEALYGDLPYSRRASAHRRAARVLAEAGAPADDVAGHLLLTDPEGDPRTVERLAEAARDALARAAPGAAAGYLRRALAEPPPPELRAGLLLLLGEAEARAGSDEAAVRALREVVDLADDQGDLARAAIWLARALIRTGRAGEAVEVLESAIARVRAAPRELRLRLELELQMFGYLTVIASRRRRRRSARSSRPRRARLEHSDRLALVIAANDECLFGRAAEAARLAELALDGGDLLATERPDGPAFQMAASVLLYTDRLDQAEHAYAAAVAEAERRGLLLGAALARCFRSGVHLRRGSLAEAEADARAGLDARRYGLRLEPNPAIAFLVEALVERGEVAAAARILSEAGLDGPLPELLTTNLCQHARGRLRAAQRDLESALADHLECRRRERQWGVSTPAFAPSRAAVARALADLGRHEEARQEAEAAVVEARAFGAPRALGVALTTVAMLTGSLESHTEAVAVLERSGARLEHARALIELGAALRRKGRRGQAQAPLKRGLQLARVCGARPLAERAHDELTVTGARPRKVVRGGRDALTAAERRVTALAAQGHTNQQIAHALTLSTRTVETHLARAYQKLDISSRRELHTALT